MDFGTIKAVFKDGSSFQPKLLNDVLFGGLVGCGGQRQHWHIRKVTEEFFELGVGWAKIVAPCAYAMRLIDCNHVNVGGLELLKQSAMHACHALWGDVQQFQIPRANGIEYLVVLLWILAGVEICGVDALQLQVVHLVLHQSDQW